MPDANVFIRRNANDYAQVIADLLPVGAAWPRDDDAELMQLVAGFAEIFGYIDLRIADFFGRESDPRATREMLDSWEITFGLPDPCTAEPLTIEDRVKALIVKMTSIGGQSRAFFIEAAAKLGYVITIDEWSPFMCGISQCGDTRLTGTANEQFLWEIGDPNMRFYWRVRLNQTRLSWFRAGSGQTGVDPHLRIGLATDLECILRRWKPAQTEVIFSYVDTSTGGALAGLP